MRENLDEMMISQGLPRGRGHRRDIGRWCPRAPGRDRIGGRQCRGHLAAWRRIRDGVGEGLSRSVPPRSRRQVVTRSSCPITGELPKAPFPAAVHDAAAVMDWAEGNFPGRWVLAGDSAGGGLTMASLIRARDHATPLPVGAVLMSPLADFTACGESFDTHAATDAAISRRSVQSLAVAYLRGHDPRDPLASPLFGVLDRLPPTLILASDREVLLDDAKTLHGAMQRDGSPSSLAVYSGVCHAWTMFASYMPRAQRAVAEIGNFIREVLPARPTV